MSSGRRSLVVFSLLLSLPPVAVASGELDPSFGTSGVVTVESGSWGSRFYAGGATGSLDPANMDAVVLVGAVPGPVGPGSYGAAISSTGALLGAQHLGLAAEMTNFGTLQAIRADPTDPSHRLYAVGYQYTEGAAPPYSFLVARLTPLGAGFDPAWGGGAPIVTAVAGTTQARASTLTVQPDGKLLVAGPANANLADVAVARYDAAGALDPTFGSGGTTVVAGAIVSALAIQGDGKILLAGYFVDGDFGGFGVARLLADGTLDPTFGSASGLPGITATGFRAHYTQGFAVGVDVLGDGRIVAAGSEWDPYARRGQFVAARYLADGELDPSFGRRGRARKRVGKSNAAGAIGFLSDGKILIAGSTRRHDPEHHTDIALLRLDADGKPDRGFGKRGKVQTPVVPDWEGFAVRDVVVDSLGRTTVVGVSADGSGKATILARYLP
jgi:uncharacterized delta-60 repeat protein